MSTLHLRSKHRSLAHYPSNGRRIWYLALAIITTITLSLISQETIEEPVQCSPL